MNEAASFMTAFIFPIEKNTESMYTIPPTKYLYPFHRK